MRRIIVHAGFHKTGTTTVQKTLRANRRLLRDHVRIVLRPGMVAACEAARAYSQARDPVTLALFGYELAQLADGWRKSDTRPVLLASEDLAGHMPGRRELRRYDATPRLMQTLAATFGDVLGQVRLAYYFSTRKPAPWLRSCYHQHLRATRITQTAEEYARAHASSARLGRAVYAVRKAVAPHPVSDCLLEDTHSLRLGPVDPVLDLLDIPAEVRAQIVPQPPANTAPSSAKAHALLSLNRSDLDDTALKAAKRAVPG